MYIYIYMEFYRGEKDLGSRLGVPPYIPECLAQEMSNSQKSWLSLHSFTEMLGLTSGFSFGV